MAIKLTGPQRLQMLMPWINEPLSVGSPTWAADGLEMDYDYARDLIATFIATFDGSASAGFVDCSPLQDEAPYLEPHRTPYGKQLEALHQMLRSLFHQAFTGTPAWAPFAASSLRFAIRALPRAKPVRRVTKAGNLIVDGGIDALRQYYSAGAYVLRVNGHATELVPFLIAHLLTQANMVGVQRCVRPGCSHVFVVESSGRGRPQVYCSPACGERHRELKRAQQQVSEWSSEHAKKATRKRRRNAL